MVLDCFNDETLSVQFEQLLGNKSVTVVKGYIEMGKIAIWSVEVCWVAEGTLVVGNGPSRSRHNAQIVVSVGVDRADQSVLSAELCSVY